MASGRTKGPGRRPPPGSGNTYRVSWGAALKRRRSTQDRICRNPVGRRAPRCNAWDLDSSPPWSECHAARGFGWVGVYLSGLSGNGAGVARAHPKPYVPRPNLPRVAECGLSFLSEPGPLVGSGVAVRVEPERSTAPVTEVPYSRHRTRQFPY